MASTLNPSSVAFNPTSVSYTNAVDSNTSISTIITGESLIVKGSIIMNGVNLEKRLSTIEQVLNIPTRDATMEEKYPKLKKIYEEYITELEKYKTWDNIKDSK